MGWAFAVWGSNYKISIDLCRFLCFSAQLSPPPNIGHLPHEKPKWLLVIIFFRQKSLQNKFSQDCLNFCLKIEILHKHMIKVNDPPHQVLDDKIFICHVGLPVHSEGSILVKNGSKALAKVEIKLLWVDSLKTFPCISFTLESALWTYPPAVMDWKKAVCFNIPCIELSQIVKNLGWGGFY